MWSTSANSSFTLASDGVMAESLRSATSSLLSLRTMVASSRLTLTVVPSRVGVTTIEPSSLSILFASIFSRMYSRASSRVSPESLISTNSALIFPASALTRPSSWVTLMIGLPS